MTEVLILVVSISTVVIVGGVIIFVKTQYDAAVRARDYGLEPYVTNSRKHGRQV